MTGIKIPDSGFQRNGKGGGSFAMLRMTVKGEKSLLISLLKGETGKGT
jgi:hypothetical protein